VSLKQQLMAQFKRPSGMLGQLAGFIMAHRSSNIERNKWTLDILALKPTDRVLEIGYGPGIALEQAATIVTKGKIIGVDHSETMLVQASNRNKDAIHSNCMKLYAGILDALPSSEQPFDKIYSNNVVQFWDDLIAEFTKLRKLLASDGLIATTYMPRHATPTKEDTRRMAEKIEIALQQSGFKHIDAITKPFGSVDAVCVLASEPSNR